MARSPDVLTTIPVAVRNKPVGHLAQRCALGYMAAQKFSGGNMMKTIALPARINELGRQITEEYSGRNPLLLCVLNGAFPFAADLFRRIETDAEIAFIRFKSYDGMSSTGNVKQLMGLTENIEGRPVMVCRGLYGCAEVLRWKYDEDHSAPQGARSVCPYRFRGHRNTFGEAWRGVRTF